MTDHRAAAQTTSSSSSLCNDRECNSKEDEDVVARKQTDCPYRPCPIHSCFSVVQQPGAIICSMPRVKDGSAKTHDGSDDVILEKVPAGCAAEFPIRALFIWRGQTVHPPSYSELFPVWSDGTEYVYIEMYC